MVVSVYNSMLGSKFDAGKANTQFATDARNCMYVAPQTHDVFGRENLCQSSLFSLYPGKADCVYQGLLTTETNMRPAYWRYIGDCSGTDEYYVGGKRQMVLGYPGTSYVFDRQQEALQDVNCNSLGCSTARNACNFNKSLEHLKKLNYHTTSNSLASTKTN